MKKEDIIMMHEALDFAIQNGYDFQHYNHINGFGFYDHKRELLSDKVYLDWDDKKEMFEEIKNQMIKG